MLEHIAPNLSLLIQDSRLLNSEIITTPAYAYVPPEKCTRMQYNAGALTEICFQCLLFVTCSLVTTPLWHNHSETLLSSVFDLYS